MKIIKFKTPRLIIKTITEENTYDMFEYRSDHNVSKFHLFHPQNIEEIKDFIKKYTKTFNKEGTWFQLGIFLNTKMIGDLGIHFMGPDNMQCEIGFTIHPHYQRRGYGKESVYCLIDHLFNILRKHRIIASTRPDNTASIALLEKSGFRKEGCFVKSILNEEIWEDDLRYAMLREEWQP
jgi:RimJ/RimL family protein N-acetyltransferase